MYFFVGAVRARRAFGFSAHVNLHNMASHLYVAISARRHTWASVDEIY